MPDRLHEELVGLKFRCRRCQRIADATLIDNTLDRVHCVTCGIDITGDAARVMTRNLLIRYRDEMAQHLLLGEINRRGIGRVPLNKVGDMFGDPRWPFVLIVDHGT